jgi:hypothetical protein
VLITIATLVVGGIATAATPSAAATQQGITHDENPRVPEGAVWTEAYFPSADHSGVELHAEVLRPADLPSGARTPVILAVGPYFSHAGQTGPEGWTQAGPSDRFADSSPRNRCGTCTTTCSATASRGPT